jgi:hypothetical protein
MSLTRTAAASLVLAIVAVSAAFEVATAADPSACQDYAERAVLQYKDMQNVKGCSGLTMPVGMEISTSTRAGASRRAKVCSKARTELEGSTSPSVVKVVAKSIQAERGWSSC